MENTFEHLYNFVQIMDIIFNYEEILNVVKNNKEEFNEYFRIEMIAFYMGEYAIKNVQIFYDFLVYFHEKNAPSTIINDTVHQQYLPTECLVNGGYKKSQGKGKGKGKGKVGGMGNGCGSKFIQNCIYKVKAFFATDNKIKPILDADYLKQYLEQNISTNLKKNIYNIPVNGLSKFYIELEKAKSKDLQAEIDKYLSNLKTEIIEPFRVFFSVKLPIGLDQVFTSQQMIMMVYKKWLSSTNDADFLPGWRYMVIDCIKNADLWKGEPNVPKDEEIIFLNRIITESDNYTLFNDQINALHDELLKILNKNKKPMEIKDISSLYLVYIDNLIPSLNNINIVSITNSLILAYNYLIGGEINNELPDAVRFLIEQYLPHQGLLDFKKNIVKIFEGKNYSIKNNSLNVLYSYFSGSLNQTVYNNSVITFDEVEYSLILDMTQLIKKCETVGYKFEVANNFLNDRSQHDALSIEEVVSRVVNTHLNIKEESPSIAGGMGLKLVKTYLDKLYLCNDNRKRKAFRIKGRKNTIYVLYKKRITKASEIPKNKIK